MKNILVGLHFRKHDANISIYDGRKFFYHQIEREEKAVKRAAFNATKDRDGFLLEYPSDLFSPILKLIFTKYNLDIKNIASIAVGDSHCFLNAPNQKYKKTNWFSDICKDVYFVDHHYAHHLSNFSKQNSWILDGHGNELRYSTIFKKNTIKETLKEPEDGISLGAVLENFGETSVGEQNAAGHMMALDSLGTCNEEYFKKHKNDSIKNSLVYSHDHKFFTNWAKQINRKSETFPYDYIKTLHEITKQTHLSYLKNFFNKEDKFLFSGGVSQSIVLNTFLKKEFPNLEITPHGYDGGISLGLLYFLIDKYSYDLPSLNKFPFIQADEHPGLPLRNTIKKTAEYLAKGKIVLWYQENGEIGPRALGNRSILGSPLIADMKQKINNKVKKRAWYRPYGASVLEEDYKTYFDLKWKSPYMLYQAKVIESEFLKPITHFDGTCRIQTVESKQSIFYELIESFKKITGVPILLNTSFNLPGKPIVGTKNDAKLTFEDSRADVLVMGDEILEK